MYQKAIALISTLLKTWTAKPSETDWTFIITLTHLLSLAVTPSRTVQQTRTDISVLTTMHECDSLQSHGRHYNSVL